METCSKSPLILLKLVYLTLLPVLDAQKIQVQPEVTAYLGQDVTLPCQFIPGPEKAHVTQVQWKLNPPEGEEILIIVFHVYFGVVVQDTFLKDRVKMTEHSLIIRKVEMRDAGLYNCIATTFPSGSFEETTKLVVEEQMKILPIIPRMIAAGVFVLIVVTMFVTTYFIIVRIRREALVKQRVSTVPTVSVMCD